MDTQIIQSFVILYKDNLMKLVHMLYNKKVNPDVVEFYGNELFIVKILGLKHYFKLLYSPRLHFFDKTVVSTKY